MREGFSSIPDITWDDVGGLTSLKKIFEVIIIDRIKYPEVYKKNKVKFADGILLYGPLDCGKTLIAKAGANFIQSCFLVDALAGNCEGKDAWVAEQQLAQLLLELDGAKEKKGVFVIAATNRPDAVDPALLRPRRLGKVVYVPLPNSEERLLILKSLAQEMSISEDVDLVALAEECSNFSGADLDSLMNGATEALTTEELDCIRWGIEFTQPSVIKPSHFRQVLQTMTPSVSAEVISSIPWSFGNVSLMVELEEIGAPVDLHQPPG